MGECRGSSLIGLVDTLQETLYGGYKWVEILLEGGGNDGMIGIEIPVREVVAHARDICPWNQWFVVANFRLDVFTASPISIRWTRTAS